MIEIDVDRLRTLGLTPALATLAAAAFAEIEAGGAVLENLQLLRLTEVHRETMRLHDGALECSARVLPRLVRALADDATALAVGDWVLAAPDAHGDAWVRARVPPVSHISRRDADGRRHPAVSNVDTALLVMGLDDDFSPRRMERYLALIETAGTRAAGITGSRAGGITPVVVLTKADLASGVPGLIAARIEALRGRVAARIDLFAVDGTDPYTQRQLHQHLGAGQTLVVLGSSGAGKSTLTNTLLGAQVQDTGVVRAHDSRGKHTTTSRSLHLLPGGACVIDTPGLRALRNDADAATLAASFGDIEAFASGCRFRDCTHADEPGCAVREGVPADRLRNYQKLLREARRDSMGVLERHQQLSVWKARSRASRERSKIKRSEA